MQANVPDEDISESLNIFLGDASEAEARVYVRLDRVLPGDWQLQGFVRGPKCHYARTLEVNVSLGSVDGGSSPADETVPLCMAMIPDPCFWTIDMPFLYDVHVELCHAGKCVAVCDRTIGLRRLGRHGKQLKLEAKNWVLRGAQRQNVSTEALPSWRDAAVAMMMRNPQNEILREASRIGVLVVAVIDNKPSIDDDDDDQSIARQLRNLARWPAAAIALFDGVDPQGENLRQIAPNLLLAQMLPPETIHAPADWANLVVCQADDLNQLAQRVAACPLPVIAQRGIANHTSVLDARTACDVLQRDLAGKGEFAGYLV